LEQQLGGSRRALLITSWEEGSVGYTDTTFESLRGRLFGLSYRMLGSRSEAEDIVQDTYLRWHQADQQNIDNAEAWLVTTATRRAIDRLRALKKERDAYHGVWLPEPLLHEHPPAPDRSLEVSSDLSMAFMMLLERLAPHERAAFLLYEVFECDYAQISKTLDKSPSACRQIVHRARQRIAEGRARFRVSEAARINLLQKFTAAMEAPDQNSLLALFATDATWTADGGGIVPASPRRIIGGDRIAKLIFGLLTRIYRGRATGHVVSVNGEAGVCVRVDGRIRAVLSIETDGTRISDAWVVVNPQKLALTDPS
jgi:RNA polymerase sigma-70 factor (ECF subfamily)